jgi:hypothetical protein
MQPRSENRLREHLISAVAWNDVPPFLRLQKHFSEFDESCESGGMRRGFAGVAEI